jgi:hypothetical protein
LRLKAEEHSIARPTRERKFREKVKLVLPWIFHQYQCNTSELEARDASEIIRLARTNRSIGPHKSKYEHTGPQGPTVTVPNASASGLKAKNEDVL